MTGTASLTLHQTLGLIEESRTAAGLLRAGLVGLQEIDGANQFYRVPMMLLGQGLERLMKVAYALVVLEDSGTLPPPKAIRDGFGHDLRKLLEACAAIAARPTYHGRPAAAEDAAFLASDPDLRALVEAIAGFGNDERYAELGWFLGDPTATAHDPSGRVDALEMAILNRHPEWKAKLADPDFSGFYPVLVGDLTAVIQRLARALTRFLVWDLAGDLGRRASGPLLPFATLRDAELRSLPRRWR
jgi:hypothetical protein